MRTTSWGWVVAIALWSGCGSKGGAPDGGDGGLDDGGLDAGLVDAGPGASRDGGGAVDLFVAANGTGAAFAWVPRQGGDIALWELYEQPAGGGSAVRVGQSPTALTLRDDTLAYDGGAERAFFIVGRTSAGHIAVGSPLMPMESDAGTRACVQHADCPQTQVCDLFKCVTQTCVSGSGTCPVDYACVGATSTCFRTGGGSGGFDAGNSSNDAGFVSRPFVSELAVVQPRPAMPPEGSSIGGAAGRRPDVVAFDTARSCVVVEQQGQLFSHRSAQRGADLGDPARAQVFDTLGTRVRLAATASGAVFACYNAGTGVRVQVSQDACAHWPLAATIDADADAGITRIFDCAISPWKNGGALLAYVVDDRIVARTVSPALELGTPEIAFTSSERDGGGINTYGPQRLAMATLPSKQNAWIGFTGSRTLSGGGSDLDVYGVSKLGGATFAPATLINATGLSVPSGFPQDYVALAVDPVTERPIAAFSALENSGSGLYSTVYLSLYAAGTNTWGTAGDLTVQAKLQATQTFPLFPGRGSTDIWDAFSPSIAITPQGKIWVSFVAGPHAIPANLYSAYAVGFDFNATSPIGSGAKAWFVPPALKLSSVRVLDPRPGTNAVPANVSSSSADAQLSVYTVFSEGTGALFDTAGRAMFVPLP